MIIILFQRHLLLVQSLKFYSTIRRKGTPNIMSDTPKMRMETQDMSLNNIEKLAALFPSVMTESRNEQGELVRAIDFEKLRMLLGDAIVAGDERYDFTWVGKNAAIQEYRKPIRKTLRPYKDESKNWDSTENLYIEGDNLDVLKLLQESYLGKVKMIYIDPPYNTGNDSFVYPDKYTMDKDEYEEGIGLHNDEGEINFKQNNDSNPRFHSDWCSMMYSRLTAAYNLLRDDGVIFISIDDKEVANLRKICDDVFGEKNYRNTFSVRRRTKSLSSQFDNGLKTFNVGFEYVICYSKSDLFLFNPIRLIKEDIPTKGTWNVFWSNADRPTMRYEILGFTPLSGQWRWSKEKAIEAIENYNYYLNNISIEKSLEDYWHETGKKLKFLRRIEKGDGKNGGVQCWVPPYDSMLRTTSWTDIEVTQIKKDFELFFDNPKSLELLKTIISTNIDNNDIILDFFSGSATTAHAVMQLNAEDGGKRKFIMVQLPEKCGEQTEAFKEGYKNICEIGKERIRRAGDKIVAENPLLTGDLDTGFRVFKLDDSNMKDVYFGAEELSQTSLQDYTDNIKPDRTDLDLFFSCLLEWGIPLSCPQQSEQIENVTVHSYTINTEDNDILYMGCFATKISENVVREIAKRKPLRVVFRDSSFESSAARINVEEFFKLLSPNTTVQVL